MRKQTAIAKLKEHENAIRALGATALFLYGSTARDEADLVSDVDVFIEHDPNSSFSLFDLIGIKHFLEDQLNVEVDVAMREGLHPRLKKRIEKSAIKIF